MKTILITATLLLAGIYLSGCMRDENGTADVITPMPGAVAGLTPEMQVKRGEYLVKSIGCDDCHSPKNFGPNGPEIDFSRRLSGRPADQPMAEIADKSVLNDYALFAPDLTAAVGQWGTSFAANLTPDETGIGNWSEAQFLKAIREGKSKGLDGGRPLLPPMPWFVYRNMTDEDLKSIFAYLKTLPPVRNIVPAPVPPAPQGQLSNLIGESSN
ncbi:MAG: diheme cytochrome c-553 [Lewinellaceae bacterium]|nr:diheme cytochrome c-553 [Lewinellaceae bacterium]